MILLGSPRGKSHNRDGGKRTLGCGMAAVESARSAAAGEDKSFLKFPGNTLIVPYRDALLTPTTSVGFVSRGDANSGVCSALQRNPV